MTDPETRARELREKIRLSMLEQPTTDDRNTYTDGFANGLAFCIEQIDAGLTPPAIPVDVVEQIYLLRQRDDDMCTEAATALERLAGENARLREALAEVAGMETKWGNATVRKMGAHARAVLSAVTQVKAAP